MSIKPVCYGKATDYDPPVFAHDGTPSRYEFGTALEDLFEDDSRCYVHPGVVKVVGRDYRGNPLGHFLVPEGQLMAYLACWDKENFERLVNGLPLVRR